MSQLPITKTKALTTLKQSTAKVRYPEAVNLPCNPTSNQYSAQIESNATILTIKTLQE